LYNKIDTCKYIDFISRGKGEAEGSVAPPLAPEAGLRVEAAGFCPVA
jgi:hypothetical protein